MNLVPYGICTNMNQSWRMSRIEISGILILDTIPNLVIINNNKKNFAFPTDYRVKIKDSERRDHNWTLSENIAVKHGRNGNMHYNWRTWNDPKRFRKGVLRVRNRKTRRDHQNYNIVSISQNREMSPEYPKRLAVSLTLVSRTSKNIKIMILMIMIIIDRYT